MNISRKGKETLNAGAGGRRFFPRLVHLSLVRVWGWLIFLNLLSLFLSAQVPPEEIKAQLFKSIVGQVVWPNEAEMGNTVKPFIIGFFGDNPLGEALGRIYLRENTPTRINNRDVQIKYIKRIEEISGCDLLYIQDFPKRIFSRIIDFCRDKPVLTVGDTEGYEMQGIHVNLVEIQGGNRIGIVINESAARQAGLLVKKELLNASRVINPYVPEIDKAETLDPITRFVTWPSQTGMDNPAIPFKITVIGESPFADYLENIYRRRKLKNKGVLVKRVSNIQEIDGPDVLFISASMRDRIADIISYVRRKPILTIGDTGGFRQAGVHINFYYDQVTLNFEVNEEAAKEAGLSFSYHLMKRSKPNPAPLNSR